MEARIPVFDNIKFLLIVFVIYAHLINIGCAVPWNLYNIIYSFHMPLFIMVSGYFTSKSKDTVKFWRSNRNLASLFLIFSVFAACVNVFVYHKPAFSSVFVPQFALWYLLCIIYWRIIVFYLPERVLKSSWTLMLAFVFSVLPCVFQLNYFSLSRCLTFFPYFLLGWLCKQNKWLEKIDNAKTPLKVAFVLGGVVCCVLATKIPTPFYWGLDPVGYPLLKIITCKFEAWGVSLVNSIAIYILMPKNKGVREGQYTLFYYLYHTILLFPVFDFLMKLVPKTVLTSLLALSGVLLTLYLLRKVQLLNKLLSVGK